MLVFYTFCAWWNRLFSGCVVSNDEAELLWLKSSFRRGKTDRIERFLECGGNPNLGIDNGYPLLVQVVEYHNTHAVELLLKNKDILITERSGDFNALCTAAFNGYPDITKLILAQGIEVDSVWMHSTTALHEACMMRCGHPCPAWDITDEVFSPAEVNRFIECASILIEAGADVNAVCHDWPGPVCGFTPLHFACEAGCLPMAKLLVKHGADTRLKDEDGRTPLDLAIELNKSDIRDYLEAL